MGPLDEYGRLDAENACILPGWNRPAALVVRTTCLGMGDESNLGPHVVILVRPHREDCDADVNGPRLVGISTGLSFMARCCPHVAHQSLCTRHGGLFPPCVATVAEFAEFVALYEPMVRAYYPEELVWLQDHWIDRWPAHKRDAIVRSTLNDEYAPRKIKAMVKRESLRKVPTKGRLIQFPENFATQARFAPEICALQKAVGKAMCGELYDGIAVTFASGMNSTALGAWLKNAIDACGCGVTFLESDCKRWDSTMSELHHKLKVAMYACAGALVRDYVDDCADTTNRYRKGAHRLTWRIKYTTKSGLNDTSLGNGVVNAAIAYVVMRRMGMRGHIIVAGDDLLIVVFGDFDPVTYERETRRFGVLPECRKFDSPWDISFISGIWFPGRNGAYVFTPKPARLMSGLFWTVKSPRLKRLDAYVSGVARGLLPTCGSLPVVGAFLKAHYVVRGARSIYKWGFDDTQQAFSEDIYEHFCRRYRLDLEEVMSTEREFMRNGPRPGVYEDRVITAIAEQDLADPLERPLVELADGHMGEF